MGSVLSSSSTTIEPNPSSTEPEPTSPKRLEEYDVFLSFRGKDTRDNFTGHLFNALKAKEILTYIDYRLERGAVISPSLLKAIKGSKMSIVIFSEHYADSKWCLEELLTIVDCMKKGQTVIPVFYKVDPSNVDDQTGTFGKAFEELVKSSTLNEVQNWRAALKEVANLSGWDLFAIRSEAKLIKKITKDALEKLKQKASIYYAKGLVGIEPRVEEFESLLSLESSDVRIVGIWGKDGLGKTTLARAVYDRIGPEFKRCCFLQNTREKIQKHPLDQLQDELFKALLEPDEHQTSSTINLRRPFIKDRLCRKKVLIVVDDVDSSTQVQELLFASEPDFFGPGSRILLTGRDKQVVMNVAGVDIFKMRELNDGEALQLFSMNAFKKEHPPIDRKSQSDRVVEYAKGNPLTLTGLGRALFDKSEKDWESTLETLRDIPNQRINDVLRTMESGLLSLDAYSYDILTWMLLISSVGGELKFENANLESLQQALRMKMNPAREALTNQLSSPMNLEVLWLKDCKGCKHLPPLDQIHSLKELYIDNLADLEYIHMMGNNDSTKFFPSLKKVWIWNCYYLKGWRKPKNDNETATTSIAELPRFPCLSLLEIKYCPNLSYMPLFPFLDERLYYVKSGIEPLLQTIKIKTVSTQLEGPQPQLFAKVKELWLSELEDLEYLDAEGQRGSTVCPCLKKLWIYYCPKLKGWWKRGDDPTMTAAELARFPCLSLLKVKYCPELSCMPLFPSLDEEFYYVKTGIEPLLQTIKIKTLSSQIGGAQPQLFAKVKELWLSELDDLEYIDCERTSWKEGSTVCPSLKKLWIDYCPKLKGWWKRDYGAMKTTIAKLPQFPSLSLLEIKHCPKLSCMPLFPFLDERLYYVKSGIEPLLQTVRIRTMSIQLEGAQQPQLFTDLKEMELSELDELEYIDIEGQRVSTMVCPSLKKLWITYCPKLKGWWKRDDDTSTTRAELPQFPCLSLLVIKHCPNLSCMPLFPYLDERLYYVKSGIEPLLQTIKIQAQGFTDLQEMWLSELEYLEYIVSEEAGSLATVCPSLRKLWIHYCPNLKGWWKMSTEAARELPHFTSSLSLMEIKYCPNLVLMPLFPSLDDYLLLEDANIEPLQRTMKMTAWGSSSSLVQPLSRLKVLKIVAIEDLESLPTQWLRNLVALQELHIKGCLCLTSLPQEMRHLTSLRKLHISECPILRKRCRNNDGADWPNIAHIPIKEIQ